MSSHFARSVAKRLVPAKYRSGLRRLYHRVANLGWRRHCNVCNSALRGFRPYGTPSEPDFLCPVCLSKPPHRLAAQFFASNAKAFVPGGLLVHIAPEPELSRRLHSLADQSGMRYRKGNISGTGEAHLDLLGLPFADSEVSLMYCCHVLNCMDSDRAAMREVHRVMRADGLALLQVPAFRAAESTLETAGEAERIAAFGDPGIYRCYTNEDYEARLRSAGFEVTAYRAVDLPAGTVQRHGLKKEVMHICQVATSP